MKKISITYYTDPLCCWSWGFEPQWRRLLFEYEGSIAYQYAMGGLLPDWTTFNDPTNHVTRPIQMGPVWMHAAEITGMPMQTTFWMANPPVSSYPGCIAVCSARLQSDRAADAYLRLLREAVMLEGKNLADTALLQSVAVKLAANTPGEFNTERFRQDIENGNGLAAFKEDMGRLRQLGISRFPTLVIKNEAGQAIMITGYRTYPQLLAAIENLSPNLLKTREHYTIDEFRAAWPHALPRELGEVQSADEHAS